MNEQLTKYLDRIGQQYTARRHATIVACMVTKFGVAAHQAEAAIARWLESRT